MMEYVQIAAFGWATLTWWTWPLLFLVVLTAVYVAVRLGFREDDSTAGPCLAHLGTEADGMEWWCMLKHGHDGTHLNQWGVDPSEEMEAPGPGVEQWSPYTPPCWAARQQSGELMMWCTRPLGHDGEHEFTDVEQDH